MSVYTIVSGLKQFQAELNIPHLLLKKSTNICVQRKTNGCYGQYTLYNACSPEKNMCFRKSFTNKLVK